MVEITVPTSDTVPKRSLSSSTIQPKYAKNGKRPEQIEQNILGSLLLTCEEVEVEVALAMMEEAPLAVVVAVVVDSILLY
jgi:hypothetical protein